MFISLYASHNKKLLMLKLALVLYAAENIYAAENTYIGTQKAWVVILFVFLPLIVLLYLTHSAELIIDFTGNLYDLFVQGI